MNYPTHISLTAIDLHCEKEIDQREYFIDLHKNYLHYRARYFAMCAVSCTDLELGFEYGYNAAEAFALKGSITDIEVDFIKKQDIWKISIAVKEMETIMLYFERESEAQKVSDILKNYLFQPENKNRWKAWKEVLRKKILPHQASPLK